MSDVRLEGVGRTVDGEVHLDGVDLTVAAGRMTALLGPTRAGKTSLLRLIAGLDRPTRGAVDVSGTVAMVYQEFVNYPSLTVFENIASPLRVARTPRGEVDRRVREIAARLGLGERLGRRPEELSGGEQQRVAIGRALARDADVVLLDEPLANLDLKLREELRAELRRLFEDRRRTVLLATTDPAEALSFGGDVAVLDAGRLLAHGAARDLYDRPPDRSVAARFGDPPMQFLPVARADLDGRAALALPTGVRVETPLAGAVSDAGAVLGVRPHHFALAPRGPQSVRLDARWERVERHGAATRVRFRHGPLRLEMLVSGAAVDDAAGAAHDVWLDPRRALLFAPDGRRIDLGEGADGAD